MCPHRAASLFILIPSRRFQPDAYIGSGKSLFELHWDPRPHVGVISVPALSPDGRRLAAIRHGFLEVFEIP
jgi:hypothetical protein